MDIGSICMTDAVCDAAAEIEKPLDIRPFCPHLRHKSIWLFRPFEHAKAFREHTHMKSESEGGSPYGRRIIKVFLEFQRSHVSV